MSEQAFSQNTGHRQGLHEDIRVPRRTTGFCRLSEVCPGSSPDIASLCLKLSATRPLDNGVAFLSPEVA